METWPDDERRSELIFITRGIDAGRVADSLSTFMAAVSDHPSPRILHA